MKFTIFARVTSAAAGTALVAAAVAGGGSAARSAPTANPTMIPILEVKRLTSADHTFIDKAISLAVSSMESANAEIAVAGTVDVQDEAVRTFNTSAAAYNGLADIASRRDMKWTKPKASQLDDTPALAQDAKPTAEDVRYVTSTQQMLEGAVKLYHDEVERGKDKLAVDFASKMHSRYENDLELVKVDIETIDHPKPQPTVPPSAGNDAPDPASAAPADSPSASPAAAPQATAPPAPVVPVPSASP